MRLKKMRQAAVMAAVMATAVFPQQTHAGVNTEAEIDGSWYVLTSNNEAHLISRYYGMQNYPEGYDLVVPQTVEYEGETYTVTALKAYDIYLGRDPGSITVYVLDGEPIASLSLPSTIKEIESLTDSYLPLLTSITVDPENKYFTSIDGVLYESDNDGSCSTMLLYPRCKPETSIEIPEGVRYLRDKVFYKSQLTGIHCPSTLRSIGKSAFMGLDLKDIVLNDGLKEIGANAFERAVCHGQLVIPESVRSIGTGCFMNSKWFSNVILPEKYNSIGSHWFSGALLETFHIQEHIKAINEGAFSGSTMLYIDLPDNIQTIQKGAFQDCDGLRKIELPLGLKKLEDDVFADCDQLRNVSVNNKVKEIGAAFKGCPKLSDLYLLCETPPKLDQGCPLGYFDTDQINRLGQITVHVLEGCGEAYRNSTWAKVGPIVEDLSSEVEDLPADGAISSTETCTAYTLQGTVAAEGIPYGELREALSAGIYIIRTASGKTEKLRL